MAQGNTYRFISDGGHGWAEIPTTAVLAAGIRPSSYSYYDPSNGMTYLEEDCDVGRWLDASSNPDQGFTDVYVPGDCWVRDLPRWSQYTTTMFEELEREYREPLRFIHDADPC